MEIFVNTAAINKKKDKKIDENISKLFTIARQREFQRGKDMLPWPVQSHSSPQRCTLADLPV